MDTRGVAGEIDPLPLSDSSMLGQPLDDRLPSSEPIADNWPFDGSFDDYWLYPPGDDADDEIRYGPLSGYP